MHFIQDIIFPITLESIVQGTLLSNLIWEKNLKNIYVYVEQNFFAIHLKPT